MNSNEEHVMAVVRDGDRARYLAALLAPRKARVDLMALYSFDLETQAIADRVIEPLAGEIRIQWWRDALDPAAINRHTGNPVADIFVELVRTRNFSADALSNYLNAQTILLYPDPMPDRATLEKHFDSAHGAIIRMACRLLNRGEVIEGSEAIDAASRAIGYVHLLNEIGKLSAQGKTMLPADLLDRQGVNPDDILHGKITGEISSLLEDLQKIAGEQIDVAARQIQAVDRRLIPAFAHLATLRPILKNLIANKHAPYVPPQQLNPLTIQWRVWRTTKNQKI